MSVSHCSCFPEWLSLCVQGTICAGCKENIPSGKPYMQQVGAYTCCQKIGRTHVFSLLFHSEGSCSVDFTKSLMINDRYKLIERLPNIELLDAEKVQQKHRQTGSRCASCGTGEQSHCKFKSCSRCMQVRYCSKECQIADYPTHKEPCKLKASAMAEANAEGKVAPTVHTRDACPCFNAEDQRIFEKSKKSMCCAKKCSKIVGGAVPFSMFITECTLPLHLRKEPMHIMATCYCSDRCRKKISK